ncbi:unnamed protein product, partial [Prorocentrum cordatum]
DGVSGTIATLNELHGGSNHPSGSNLQPSAAQLAWLERIEQAHRDLGTPPADLHGQGALEELLSKQSYGGSAGAVAPLEVERVALPSLQRRPARIQDVGGSAGVKVLEVLKSLVRTSEEGEAEEERQQLRRAYNDPLIRQKPKEYAKLLRMLHERGIVEYRRSCKKSAGTFCAWKKGGEQRLILDCRVSNCWFKDAPGVSLATGDSSGRLEFEGNEPVHVSGVDIEVAFYSIGLPEELREYFGMEPVCAGAVGVGWLGGVRLHPGEKLVPVLSALHEAVAEGVAGVEGGNRPVDGRPAPSVARGPVHTEHVDNFVALGADGEEGRRMATEVGEALTADGLGVHPVTCSRGGDTLGWHFDEWRPAVGVAPRTARRLILGLRELLRRGRASGAQLRSIVGHIMCRVLLRRPILSVLHTVYAFIDRHPVRVAPLWDTVKQELEWTSRLVPLASRELNMEWSPKVTVFDASEWGHGVMERRCELGAIKYAGQYSDRPWNVSGDHVILEARAGAWALRHILRDSRAIGRRHLVLSDAMAVVLGVAKGRSSSRAMGRCLRQWAALCLASFAVVHVAGSAPSGTRRTAPRGALRGAAPRLPGMLSRGPTDRRLGSASLATTSAALSSWIPSPAASSAARGPIASSSGRRLGSLTPATRAGVKRKANGSLGEARRRRRQAASRAAGASSAAHQLAGASREVAADGRRRALLGPGLTQLERGVPPGARALTVLEDEAVGPSTQKDYRHRFGCFTRWASEKGLIWETPAKADAALVEWLNEQFFEGEPLATGTKMLAALGHLLPGVPRGALELRRSRRALQGWRRHNPSSSRLPLPWPAVAASVKEMHAQGQLAAAGATLVAFVLLLRPAETLRLAGGCLVAPVRGGGRSRRKWSVVLHPQERGVTSKVGAQDECMVFDNPEFDLVLPLLEWLLKSVPVGKPLFPLSAAQWQEALRAAARRRFPSLAAPTLYQLRHGGAPHEALTQFRSSEDLMRRGRWHSQHSVKRYEKGGRVNQVLQSLTAEELNAALEGFALEIFAGSGRLNHCWRQQAPWGLPIFEIDVGFHSSHDLSRRAAQRLILGWIRSGCCKAIWLGTPCATFSRARDSGAGPPRLRSDEQPLGLDGLSEGDRVKVEVANELCRFSAKALLCCLERGVPAALENPASPRPWLTPYMQAAGQR